MKTNIMTITPETAQKWLDINNIDNRKKRSWWSLCIAGIITRGEWQLTHQGIAFTTDGRLVDGQHRLQGIVIADVPVKMLVVTDLSDEVFKVIDCGIKRNIAELTGLDKKTAEVCRYAASLLYKRPSAEQALEVYNSGLGQVHEELIDYFRTVVKFYSCTEIRLAACISIMDGENKNYIFDVYKNLLTQNFLELPQIALCLIRQVGAGKVTGSQKTEALARGIKVFDHSLKNSKSLFCTDTDKRNAHMKIRRVIGRILTVQQ